MKVRLLVGIAFMFVCGGLIAWFTPSMAPHFNSAINTGALSASTPSWSYGSQNDEMRKTVTNFARLTSSNSIELAAPYSGGTTLVIVLRHKVDEDAVQLRVNRGQFSCSGEAKTISAKFDDGEIEQYSCKESVDHNPNVIFLNDPPRFALGLRKSHDLILEVPLFQEGNRQFKFSVGGLAWPISKEEAFQAAFNTLELKTTTQNNGEAPEHWNFTPTAAATQGKDLYVFSSSKNELDCHACSGLVRLDLLAVQSDNSLKLLRSWPKLENITGSWGDPGQIRIYPLTSRL